jgi:hypothetical protein
MVFRPADGSAGGAAAGASFEVNVDIMEPCSRESNKLRTANFLGKNG